MAARAIVGIALGFLFAPVIYILLFLNGILFQQWFWILFKDGNFTDFAMTWAALGVNSTIAPIWGPSATTIGDNSLINGIGPGSLLAGFLPLFGVTLVTWAIIGVWAGAIERSPGRGIGVGIGCWIGWLIVALILWFVNPVIAGTEFQKGMLSLGIDNIGYLILSQVLTAVVVIAVAAIFGALTKSEEF